MNFLTVNFFYISVIQLLSAENAFIVDQQHQKMRENLLNRLWHIYGRRHSSIRVQAKVKAVASIRFLKSYLIS